MINQLNVTPHAFVASDAAEDILHAIGSERHDLPTALDLLPALHSWTLGGLGEQPSPDDPNKLHVGKSALINVEARAVSRPTHLHQKFNREKHRHH